MDINEGIATSIVDNALNTLRDQDDARQEQQLRGSFTFNPSVFQPVLGETAQARVYQQFKSGDKQFLVLGPFRFDRRYAKPPQIIFGQMGTILSNPGDSPVVVGTPSSYVPFVVQVFPWQWVYANGEVDGFYVGLYALTVPPLGLVDHSITWIAVGEASRYTAADDTQAWTDSYDYNEADYLNNDSSGTPDEEMDNTSDFV